MTMKSYYGQSTLYRLIRPLAIAELIEQQITYADFSVDMTAVELLRFKRAASLALSDADPILKHPDARWIGQSQHLFSGTINKLANALIIPDEHASNKQRPMHSHEFEDFLLDSKQQKRFTALAHIPGDFHITTKPIFWARLVCFGYICNEYMVRAGSAIAFYKNYILLWEWTRSATTALRAARKSYGNGNEIPHLAW